MATATEPRSYAAYFATLPRLSEVEEHELLERCREAQEARITERLDLWMRERVAARAAQLYADAVAEGGEEEAAKFQSAGVIDEMAREWAWQDFDKRWPPPAPARDAEPLPAGVTPVHVVTAGHRRGRGEARPGSRSTTRSSSSSGSDSDPSEPEPPLARCTRPTCLGRGRWSALPNRAVCLHCLLAIAARADELKRRAS